MRKMIFLIFVFSLAEVTRNQNKMEHLIMHYEFDLNV